MCGKNQQYPCFPPQLPGSPPRVREELFARTGELNAAGITPACAGRTRGVVSPYIPYSDHPRVCGKNLAPFFCEFLFVGSPPRVREEQSHLYRDTKKIRITPACAGRTVKESPFYAFSFSNLFMNPFTFVASSLRISTFVLLCSFFFSPIP